MRGKCQEFVLYRQTWQCNENITDCGGGGGGGGKGRGFTNWMGGGEGPWFYQLDAQRGF